MADAAPQLQEAYELIESGDLTSARQLLEEIRSNNENNPDYWWIYSHAVESEDDGLAALERVRQLAPNYPGLQNLSQQLGISKPQPPPVPTPSTEAIEAFNNDNDADEFASTESSSSSLPFYLIAGITVVAIIAALFFISSLFGGDDGGETPTDVAIIDDVSPEPVIPTSVAEAATEDVDDTPTMEVLSTDVEDEPTDEPTEEIATEVEAELTDAPTEEPSATDEPTEQVATEVEEEPTDVEPTDISEPDNSDPFASIYPDLEEFGVPTDSITVAETESFGDTYIVTTCSAIGPIATQNILDIVATLQPVADSLDEDIAGIAFNITDCDTDTVSLTLGFDRETVDSYWNDEISQTDLQQSLQRVR